MTLPTAVSDLFLLPDYLDMAPLWAFELYRWLCRHGYAAHARRAIVEHAIRWGTVQCVPELDQDDLDMAEAFILESDEWRRSGWDRLRYSTGGIR